MDAYGLDCHRRSGAIASECREWARENIRPGVTVRSVLETIEEKIASHGAQPAFPAQSSRNHHAAHYCSSPEDELAYEEGDCVKVDIGVHVDGYVADTALSVDLSDDGRWQPLIDASAAALQAAIDSLEDGVAVGKVGAAIEDTIMAAGFEPVRNLTGHGIGRWKVHCPPQIPNCAERGGGRIREGMTFAIEPFASTGKGYIREEGEAEVFMLVRPPLRKRGLDPTVLGAILDWKGLPIARRYFRELDREALEDTLSRLVRQGAMHAYPPLVEEEGVMVTQTEHSLYLGPDGVEVLTA